MSDPRYVAAATLVVERATADAMAALVGAGIRSILIKGPPQQGWLAAAGVPRASVDVDLLVDPTDVAAAGIALSGLGYRREPEVTPGVEHHAELWTAPGRVPVELHRTLWGTDPGCTWPVLAGQTENAQIGSETVEIPAEGARCLIVALHAAHHGAGEEAPPYDLERAVAVAGRDAWKRAADLARALDAEAAFVAGLGLVPAGQRLRVDLGLPTLPYSERLALNAATPVAGAPGFYWLAQQKGMRAKVRFAARKIVPPADFMRFKHPYARKGAAQLLLTYLYRPLWLARWAVPGLRAWRRARLAARRSQRARDRPFL